MWASSCTDSATDSAGSRSRTGQDRPPGPALSPQEAMAKMQLPPGFKVELAAAEPDVVNPTAMTFDDRGRIWVCESVEYPRRQAGKGQDRVKILEDKDRDGTYETVKIFKDGLTIPCGVLHGNGGVYVGAARPRALVPRGARHEDRRRSHPNRHRRGRRPAPAEHPRQRPRPGQRHALPGPRGRAD